MADTGSEAAVAVHNAASDFAAVAGYDDAEWLWGEGKGDETMQPMWAVRRMTQRQLALLQSTSTSELKPRFNMEFVTTCVSNVSMGVMDGEIHNITRQVEVPLLTNSIKLLAGEELILEIPEPTPKAKAQRKRTWRQTVQADEKADQKKEKKEKKEKEKADQDEKAHWEK